MASELSCITPDILDRYVKWDRINKAVVDAIVRRRDHIAIVEGEFQVRFDAKGVHESQRICKEVK